MNSPAAWSSEALLSSSDLAPDTQPPGSMRDWEDVVDSWRVRAVDAVGERLSRSAGEVGFACSFSFTGARRAKLGLCMLFWLIVETKFW